MTCPSITYLTYSFFHIKAYICTLRSAVPVFLPFFNIHHPDIVPLTSLFSRVLNLFHSEDPILPFPPHHRAHGVSVALQPLETDPLPDHSKPLKSDGVAVFTQPRR